MGLFSKPKQYLGVDIGTSSIKVIQLDEEKGKAKLTTYGMTYLPNDLIRSEADGIIDQIADTIRLIVRKAGVTTKRAVAGLPGFAVFTAEITLPDMPEKDLQSALKFEAEKYIPTSIAGMVLDWEVIEQFKSPKGESQVKVLLTAAPKNLVQRYTQIFDRAGLELESLETEAVALVRSLVGTDPAPTLIVDLGATATDVIVVNKGTPRLTKSFDTGGIAVTEAIAKSLKIDFDQAEQFKRDAGLIGKEGEGKVPDSIKPAVEDIAQKIGHTANLFLEKGGQKIEKIILTGGTGKLPGFRPYVEDFLNIKVFPGNPWARVIFPPQLEPTLKEISSDFAIAIGLAEREIY